MSCSGHGLVIGFEFPEKIRQPATVSGMGGAGRYYPAMNPEKCYAPVHFPGPCDNMSGPRTRAALRADPGRAGAAKKQRDSRAKQPSAARLDGVAQMSNLPEITDKNFDEKVLKSTLPFLLDLSAEWCGPCKTIGPVIEQIAKELAGKLNVGKLDIDKNPNTPSSFQVMSIPTLILFKNGEVKEQMVGALPKKAILEFVNPHI